MSVKKALIILGAFTILLALGLTFVYLNDQKKIQEAEKAAQERQAQIDALEKAQEDHCSPETQPQSSCNHHHCHLSQ